MLKPAIEHSVQPASGARYELAERHLQGEHGG